MSKYIDADKLIAQIGGLTNQKKKQLERFSDEDYCCSVASSINCELSGNLEVLSIIKSLQQEQLEVDLEKAARHVYESWMGGTTDDVRRDMVELGKILNARREE